jgi:hypothetical protein
MSWTAFHFSCRFLSQKLSDGLELKPAQDLLSKSYDNYQPSNALDNPIYKEIISVTNPSKQQELLSIYGNLNMDWDVSSVAKLTNIRNYLLLIFGVFLLLSGIYKIYVLTAFKEVFSLMEAPINAQLENFTTYWLISLLLMTVVSVIILKFSSIFTQVCGISNTFSPSTISQLVTSKKIVNQIQKVQALIYAPLDKNINPFSASENEFVKQLSMDNMDTPKELQTLINAQYTLLITMINGRIKKMIFLLTLIVVGAIFNLVYSLYSPIFSMGTII